MTDPTPLPGLRALVVDDDPLSARLAARLCAQLDVSCELASDGEQALARFTERPPDLLLADLVMPKLDGRGLLTEVRRRDPQIPVIIMTAHATVPAAVELLRCGATDLLEKPLLEETFLPRLQQVLETLRLRQEVHLLRAQLRTSAGHAPFIGQSPALAQILSRLPAIAASGAAVLIGGESGTGKDLVARATHYMSPRSHGPFITLNCGAIPDDLFESELFGYVRGAFTDAKTDKPGLAMAASGGTLFLDEVGEASQRAQVKLLRFLQSKEVRPIGSNTTERVDVRIIAATNRDLAADVKAGAFREDLFYRLSILPLRLPPLRERPEDIPILCEHFLARFAKEHERAIEQFAPAALARLCSHSWPGNVRELENVLRRAVILCERDFIGEEDIVLTGLGEPPAPSQAGLTMQEAKRKVVDDFERAYLTATLITHGGNITQAARAAGKDRKTFWELLRRHDIDATRFRRD